MTQVERGAGGGAHTHHPVQPHSKINCLSRGSTNIYCCFHNCHNFAQAVTEAKQKVISSSGKIRQEKIKSYIFGVGALAASTTHKVKANQIPYITLKLTLMFFFFK